MNWSKIRHWIISTVVALLGGGAAAVVPAITDPTKYRFPQDIGSGKLWPYIFTGWALTFAGILVHSPIGQKVLSSVKESQQQLKDTQAELQQAKAVLKAEGIPLPQQPRDTSVKQKD